MFEVAEWSGESSPYDRRRFEIWLGRNMGLDKSHARHVARGIQNAFTRKRVVQPQQLIVEAGRLAASSSILARGGGGNTTMAAAFPIGAGEAVSLATGALSFVGGLIASGWKEEPGGGWVKEEGSGLLLFDDANAPAFKSIEQVGSAGCCTGNPPAVELKIKVTVSDDGGGGNDSGVTQVKLFGVTSRGIRGALRGTSVWRLSDEDSDKTESGDVSHEFTVCVPCSMIENKNADIWFEAEDDDGNCRITRMAFSVQGTVEDCCP